MNDINIEKIDPRPDVGRCNVCQSEPATSVLSIDRTSEVRFCETCFDKFRSMVVGTANPAKLFESVKDLGLWAEQVVSAPKDAGSKECGEFVKMCCKEALASKRRNCDEFAGNVMDAVICTYGRFCMFCASHECSSCSVQKLRWSSDKNIGSLPCFGIWCFMERGKECS